MFTEGGICPSEKKLEGSHELELGLVVEILSIILFLLSFQQQSAAVGEIKVVFRLIRTAFEKKLLKFKRGQSWENIKFFMKDIMTLKDRYLSSNVFHSELMLVENQYKVLFEYIL